MPRRKGPPRKPASLRARLEQASARFGADYLQSDPILYLHRFRDPADQEIVGLLASSLAYGNVKQIRAGIDRTLAILERVAPSPAAAVRALDPRKHADLFVAFKHRFNNGEDLLALMMIIQGMLRESGGVEKFFAAQSRAGAPLGERLAAFTRAAIALKPRDLRAPELEFFFPSPSSGSACKRLCMYLRWMVRRGDGIDLGLWTALSPRDLVMPLDTHTSRIAYANGLSPSPYATWKNAERVTDALRRYDPEDPVRFDFALSRLGILRISADESPVRLRARR